MTRHPAGLALALALTAASAQAAVAVPAASLTVTARGATEAPILHKVEYYCSPGFEPSYGGTCLAVPPRAEIELFVDQPIYATEETRVVRHYRRHLHGLRARF